MKHLVIMKSWLFYQHVTPIVTKIIEKHYKVLQFMQKNNKLKQSWDMKKKCGEYLIKNITFLLFF